MKNILAIRKYCLFACLNATSLFLWRFVNVKKYSTFWARRCSLHSSMSRLYLCVKIRIHVGHIRSKITYVPFLRSSYGLSHVRKIDRIRSFRVANSHSIQAFISSSHYRPLLLSASLISMQGTETSVLFCSLAVLEPRVGHTMDVLYPFISVLCHSD